MIATESRPAEAASAEAPESLRRVLIARVLPTVAELLRPDGRLNQEEATDALRRALADLSSAASSEPGTRADSHHPAERPYAAGHKLLAVTLPVPLHSAVTALAQKSFGGDAAATAGWLLARGTGLRLGLPGTERAAPPRPAARVPAPVLRLPSALPGSLRSDPDPSSARAISPLPTLRPAPAAAKTPRRAADPNAPKRSSQVVVDAPSADELRGHRERLGLSQKEVALAAGLSRGLVAEVERGRRANGLTRLRIAETLTALERAA